MLTPREASALTELIAAEREACERQGLARLAATLARSAPERESSRAYRERWERTTERLRGLTDARLRELTEAPGSVQELTDTETERC